jgi:hypothetical protein
MLIETGFASNETLMRQASATADEYLHKAVEGIDGVFGEGFAKAHPELIAAHMQTAALDFGASVIANALRSISTHIKYLGNGDAATTMGAVEGLGMVIGEKLDALVSAVGDGHDL